MMSASPPPQDFQDYLPLARVVYPGTGAASSADTGAGAGLAPARIHELLARLFVAASRGEGAVAVSETGLSEEEKGVLLRLTELFVLDGSLLLLPRYASQLRAMRAFFATRLAKPAGRFEDAEVRAHLDALLPAETVPDPASDGVLFDNLHQRLAVAALVDTRVGVLTGGPGTGKTTTAAALLAARRRLEPGLNAAGVLVTAPTGKAACRIGEALTRATGTLQGLAPDEKNFLQSIRCLTLHRALEWGPEPPEKGGPFRRNRLRRLEARVVLVDEASMVDLSLMHALLEALPEDASLLLLGDSDQLKSVEVGGILAELVLRSAWAGGLAQGLAPRLCARLGVSPDTVERAYREGLPAATPAAGGTTLSAPLEGLTFGLKYSRRAMHAPWILRFAEIVRPEGTSTVDTFRSFLRADPDAAKNIGWMEQAAAQNCLKFCATEWSRWLEQASGWTRLFSTGNGSLDALGANAALVALGRFQLLCSTNEQVGSANAAGVRLLYGKARAADGQLPHGCPVLVTANNRALGLSNGDVGIALGNQLNGPALVGLFAGSDGTPRVFTLAQLPPHQPAFGLTIHKSQGSEWEHIAIQLPEHADSHLVTRNLLYTAITRSSRRIDLFGPEEMLSGVLAAS
jgi:exodeoxyribonuclease V alpha subunit